MPFFRAARRLGNGVQRPESILALRAAKSRPRPAGASRPLERFSSLFQGWFRAAYGDRAGRRLSARGTREVDFAADPFGTLLRPYVPEFLALVSLRVW